MIEITKGLRVDRWTVIRESRRETNSWVENVYYLVRCQCGIEKVLPASRIRDILRGKQGGGCSKRVCRTLNSQKEGRNGQ